MDTAVATATETAANMAVSVDAFESESSLSKITELEMAYSNEEIALKAVRDTVVELRRKHDAISLRKSICRLKEASREQGLPKPLLSQLLVETRKRQLILDILESSDL